MIRLALSTLCVLFCLNSFSQKEIRIEQVKTSPLIPVYMPVLIDSTDVNKKTFEHKDLLKTNVDFNSVTQSKDFLKSDTAGVFILPFAPYDYNIPYRDKAVQLLSFSIDADRYCKATLSVTTTDMMEIFVNNKSEKIKETKEDSLSKSNAIQVELTLEPRRYEVVIKRLASVKNLNESKMKISLASAKKDSLAQLSVSTNALRRVTIYDILEGNRLTSSAISPSGNYFLAGATNTLPGGKTVSAMELRETASNKTLYRFASDLSPRWIQGKDQLTYSRPGLTDKDLYLMDAATLEEKRIAEDIKFDTYQFSPDGRILLIQIKEEIPADKGDLKRTLSPSDRAGEFRGRNSVYLYDLATKTEQRITFGRTDTNVEDISLDSRKALLSVSETTITERPFSKKTFYELDLLTLAVDTLFSDPFLSGARYSPDAKQLLLIGSGEAFGGVGLNINSGQISNTYNNLAFIVDRKTKAVQPITKNFNPSVTNAYWSIYDKQIYFSVEDKDRAAVYVYDANAAAFKKLNLPEDMIRRFQTADKAPIALYQGEGTNNAYRLYKYDLKTEKSVLLDDPFQKQLSELDLSKVTDWNFTSSDGTTIEGRYYLPPGFDSNKKYPMIVYYYGGTSPTARVFESTYPLQVYAAQGYVVYTLQPSGTTGFGQEFAARHVNAWGEKTADEIIAGTQKFYREHPFVDSTKVGCIGASYGGFMTQFLQTKTNIFAAAVSHAGISNITSYWGEGYWGYAYSSGASAGSFPWNNPRLYTEQSPLFHADKINTPLLLLHGGADTNVPIGESIQMFNALRILGKTVEFVTVAGENHAIYTYQKRIDWNKTIYAWFARWLKNQPEWWQALYPDR